MILKLTSTSDTAVLKQTSKTVRYAIAKIQNETVLGQRVELQNFPNWMSGCGVFLPGLLTLSDNLQTSQRLEWAISGAVRSTSCNRSCLDIGNGIRPAIHAEDRRDGNETIIECALNMLNPRRNTTAVMYRRTLVTDVAGTRCARYDRDYGYLERKIFGDSLCTFLAGRGNLELLKWAHEQEDPEIQLFSLDLNTIVTRKASKRFEWDWDTVDAAISIGNLDCLRYAMNNGCRVIVKDERGEIEEGEETLEQAIYEGHFDIVKFMVEEPHSHELWTEHANKAAQSNNMEILMYLIDKGCEVDYTTVNDAVAANYADIVQYLISHGCDYRKWDMINSAQYAIDVNETPEENASYLRIIHIAHGLWSHLD